MLYWSTPKRFKCTMRMSEDRHKCICLEASQSFLQCGHLHVTSHTHPACAHATKRIENSPPLISASELLLFHVRLKQCFKSSWWFICDSASNTGLHNWSNNIQDITMPIENNCLDTIDLINTRIK